MNALWLYAVFVFCIYGAFSLNDYTKQQLECVEICLDSYQHCTQPPDGCGECLKNYVRDKDGNCKPEDVQKQEKEFENAKEDPVSKRNDDDAASDMNVVPVKKEEGGINYAVNQSSGVVQTETASSPWITDLLIIALIACVSAATLIGIIIALICCCKMRKSAKETSECDYSGYGSMDYKSSAMGAKSTGDRKLVQSAQMYHYQHQKQQMLEMEKNQSAVAKSGSDASSEEDNEGDEYTVYECPGLATPGELEVPNPLFSEPAASNLQSEMSQQPTEESHEPKLFNGYKEP